MHQLHLSFLGLFSARLGNESLQYFSTDKVRALLAYLAIEPGRVYSRSELAGLLWPDVADKQARQSLRSALYRLRQNLDEAGATLDPPIQISEELLLISHQTVTLKRSGLSLQFSDDVEQFRAHLAAVDAHSHDALADCTDCLSALEEAVALYQGELLAGFGLADAPEFEEWLLLQREMLHQRALLTFGELASLYERQGAFEKGASLAARLLALDPYRETSLRLWMRLLALRGLPDRALAQYAASRQLLMDEFGVEPEAETMALAEQIRRGELFNEGAGKWQGENVTLTNTTSDLHSAELTSKPHPLTSPPRHDWREMPIAGPFFGRLQEVAQLEEWLVADRCRLVSILAIGGMGKTSLAADVVSTIADRFDLVIWRSLLNAPPLAELLSGILPNLAWQQLESLPDSLDQQLQFFFDYLQDQRILLVLDNMESILRAGETGQYRAGYEAYEQLLYGISTQRHQGQLLLTSRERPTGIKRLERDTSLVQSLYLSGLDSAASKQLLVSRGLSGDESTLIERYSGNPLALKLMADTVQDLFFGDLEEFLAEDSLIFDDVRRVLDQHFERLTELEKEILFWLAIVRESVSVPALREKLLHPPRSRVLLEALNSLQRRSLIERQAEGFTLQNVIIEYLTESFVEAAIHELRMGKLECLHQHALLNAHAKEYVRRSQERLILSPIANQLMKEFRPAAWRSCVEQHLDLLRLHENELRSYAGGNLLNILLLTARKQGEGQEVHSETPSYNFSNLSIRQAFLRGATLHDFNFAGADLTDSVFTETFGIVLALAAQPNGPLLAAGTFLGPIYLYRTDDAKAVGILHGHEELVFAVTFSPDGQRLASACADGTVRVWDVSALLDANDDSFMLEPQCQILSGHEGWVQAVAYSPDGVTIASGGVDQAIRLWDSQTGAVQHVFGGDAGRIYSLTFSPDGKTLASGSADRKIHLWDVRTGSQRGVLAYPTESSGGTFGVHAICFSPDGQTLASCSPENAIYLWQIVDLATGTAQIRHVCHGHHDWISDVTFDPSSQTLASAGFDGSVRLWNVATGDARYILAGHTNQPNAVAFSADGHTLISGGADETIRFWDVQSGQPRQMLQGYTNHSAGVAFSPDGKTLATANADNAVRLWDLQDIKVEQGAEPIQQDSAPRPRRLLGHTDNVMAVKFHPDGELLASCGYDQAIYLWDRHTAQPIRTLLGHSGCVRDLVFSPDGKTLASGSYDLTVRLWDVSTGQTRIILEGHEDWILSLAISPDGALLATASDTVRLWDIQTGALLQTLPEQGSMVYDVAFSPDGQTLVAGYLNQAVCIWDVQTGQQLDNLCGRKGFVNFVAFSPDGQTLVSGDAWHWLHLWQTDSQSDPQPLSHVSVSAIKIAFSPDSQLLASGGDETVKLWSTQSGECLKTLYIPGPYHGMNITGVTGVNAVQKMALKTLGAVEK